MVSFCYCCFAVFDVAFIAMTECVETIELYINSSMVEAEGKG